MRRRLITVTMPLAGLMVLLGIALLVYLAHTLLTGL
jgi:hypothetical protein